MFFFLFFFRGELPVPDSDTKSTGQTTLRCYLMWEGVCRSMQLSARLLDTGPDHIGSPTATRLSRRDRGFGRGRSDHGMTGMSNARV